MIRCFLKFGEEAFLPRLQKNKVYFTTAKKCIEYEETHLKKGIGDRFEAGIGLFDDATVQMTTSSGHEFIPHLSMTLRLEPAVEVPLFCVFAVDDSWCNDISDNLFRIELPDGVREWFTNQFAEYTHVSVIQDAEQFCKDIVNAYPNCVHRCVDYVNKIPGRTGAHPLQILLEQSHWDGNHGYGLVDDAYQILFKKSDEFSAEHEYRFVLKGEEISQPEERDVTIHSNVEIIPVQDLWNRKPIKKVSSK